MSTIQIILCARRPTIAKSIADGLLPEFQGNRPISRSCAALRKMCADANVAVHVFNTPEQGLAAIPALLSVQKPQTSQVDAIVVGGGFSDADYSALRTACSDRRSVQWFKADRRHFASMPPLDKPEAFGAHAAERIKARLLELRIGQKDGEVEGEHLF